MSIWKEYIDSDSVCVDLGSAGMAWERISVVCWGPENYRLNIGSLFTSFKTMEEALEVGTPIAEALMDDDFRVILIAVCGGVLGWSLGSLLDLFVTKIQLGKNKIAMAVITALMLLAIVGLKFRGLPW